MPDPFFAFRGDWAYNIYSYPFYTWELQKPKEGKSYLQIRVAVYSFPIAKGTKKRP